MMDLERIVSPEVELGGIFETIDRQHDELVRLRLESEEILEDLEQFQTRAKILPAAVMDKIRRKIRKRLRLYMDLEVLTIETEAVIMPALSDLNQARRDL